jgi:hypothetical protein
MPDRRPPALARECRVRAEGNLAPAETFSDADAREGMRRIAANYEKLAERIEKEGGVGLHTFGSVAQRTISCPVRGFYFGQSTRRLPGTRSRYIALTENLGNFKHTHHGC